MNRPKDDKPQKPEGLQLQVELDDATAQGAYVNLTLVAHSATEFVLDFIFLQPQQPKAKVRSRVICAPAQAKRLLHALGENVARYEKVFGEIRQAAPPPAEPQVKLH